MSPTRLKCLADIEFAKRRALNDFYYFCNKVLGYDRMDPIVHGRMCRFISKSLPREVGEQRRKMLLEPRGIFKSTIGTVGYSLWRLVKDPNLTILINNEKLEKAADFLREIKGHITENQTFITLFGELSCQGQMGKRWNESRIDIATRTKWTKSPSIDISSTTSSVTGKHVGLIINDDLVGFSNYATSDQLAKVDDFMKDLGAVLDPGGDALNIGTIWDARDCWHTQMEQMKELGEYNDDTVLREEARDENGNPRCPSVLSDKFLKSQRLSLGAYFYNCQYNNKAISRDNAMIKRIDKYSKDIDDMAPEKFFRTKCNIFVTMDLAYTDLKRSDHTVIFIAAVNTETGKRYVVDYHIFKTTEPQEIIDRMFEVEELWKPIKWGIEANSYKSWLKIPLRDEMRKRGIYLNIDPEDGLMHYGKNNAKRLRLAKIAPPYNHGMCVISEKMTDLEDQLLILTYDGTKGHDDLLDAHAMLEEIMFWGSSEPANKYDNETISVNADNDEDDFLDKRYPDGYTRMGSQEDDENAWLCA